jgi:hypothetical protein
VIFRSRAARAAAIDSSAAVALIAGVTPLT